MLFSTLRKPDLVEQTKKKIEFNEIAENTLF
jgi:hypothetical protein